ncbi:serine/threonine-protein phosphatase 4 regulatory subunit 2 [Drosophila mauritiana]|uniref:Serine/threonine-protein phosphatase 4 regulatory subunit 2 n=1 Tax=Drosophila mauritiana TaxID=7226 RepID=A0A6P8KX06_DROMA|nr:serine/threonine-protein phosphatase 4 regulatory subunit 2 [Drosophila mauritiana]XP_033168424.1 serine/threonine-protein phosphatase 4 regulatory subunit 2 [Drosophila mauritiana]
MVTMENSEEIMQILERFTDLKQKEIPKELEEYLQYVAKTGDTIFKWSSLKYLFREKLLSVIKHFNEDSPRLEEIPNYPNVDPFNYETMKSSLLERLDLFNAAPFTVQRLCELLIDPRKQYSRIDKFMRALEKNILVVSTIDPGRKRTESENGDSLDSVVNGDLSMEVNIDIEMENNNGNAEEGSSPSSGSPGGAQKASCPRSEDNDQPKAKKAKLEIDGEERSEASDETEVKNEKDEKSDNDETDSPHEAAEIEEPDEEVDEADQGTKTTKQPVYGSQKEGEQEESFPASADDEAVDPMVSKSIEAEKELVAQEKKVEEDKKVATEPQEEIVKKEEVVESDKPDGKVAQLGEKAVVKKSTPPAEAENQEPVKAENEKEEKKQAPIETEKQDDIESTETDYAPSSEKPAEEKIPSSESKPKTKSEADPEAETKKNQPEKTETEQAEKPVSEEKRVAEPTAESENKDDLTTSKTIKDPVEESPVEDASSPAVEDLAAATTPQSPLGAADSAVETPPAETGDESQASPLAAAVTPPVLALNDQPMEDTPAEEEARVSPSAAVEEVVMAESASAGAMATEEAAKDDPAAMEVDDTSQEVMLQ